MIPSVNRLRHIVLSMIQKMKVATTKEHDLEHAVRKNCFHFMPLNAGGGHKSPLTTDGTERVYLAIKTIEKDVVCLTSKSEQEGRWRTFSVYATSAEFRRVAPTA